MAELPNYDVFLSYNSDDRDLVNTIAERFLDEFSLHPYFDSWEMIRGDHWRVALEKGLTQSKVCAIFIGPSGIGPWENRELSAYLDRSVSDNNLRVIPILLPGVEKAHLNLPPFLKSLTWVDFSNGLDNENEFTALVSSIRGIPPGRPVPAELPADSLYVQKRIRQIMASILKSETVDVSRFLLSQDSTLQSIAKRCQLFYPYLDTAEIRLKLKSARELAFQEKYSCVTENEDERFLKYEAWEEEFHALLRYMGINEYTTVQAISVGIGNGNEHPECYHKFRTLIGVDISKHSLELAKQRLNNMHGVHVEAENLIGIPSFSQDLYISLRTYQSLFFDIDESFFEAYRVLRPKGSLVISIPYVYYVNGEIMKGLIRPGSREELDIDLPYVIAERIRHKLETYDFNPVGIRTGHFEIYVYGQKGP